LEAAGLGAFSALGSAVAARFWARQAVGRAASARGGCAVGAASWPAAAQDSGCAPAAARAGAAGPRGITACAWPGGAVSAAAAERSIALLLSSVKQELLPRRVLPPPASAALLRRGGDEPGAVRAAGRAGAKEWGGRLRGAALVSWRAAGFLQRLLQGLAGS